MQRLVWKFWLAVWIAGISMLGASLLIVSQWQRFESFTRTQERPHAQLQHLAAKLEHSLKNQQSVSSLLLNNEMSDFGTVFLIRPDGTDLLQRAIPHSVLRGEPAVSDPLSSSNTVHTPAPIFARAINDSAGRTYFMIFQFSATSNPIWALFRRVGLAAVLLTTTTIAGLISLWLALLVVRPLKQLAQASAQQHQRDNYADLDDRLLHRKDEIGDLARQLNSSAKETRQTLQRQQEFIRDVSHEVRSPLARLQLASENVRLDPEDTVSLQEIEREVATIDHLVHDLLQLSKYDTESLRERFECVDLLAVLENSRHHLQTACAQKSVTIAIEDCAEPVTLFGDARLLERVFENILSNAVRHSPQGSAITLNTTMTRDGCRIDIQDQGDGVPTEQLGSIFNPFVRLDKSRQRDTGGTGVGLALVKKIVELHGGHAYAGNHQLGGLVVTVYLPVESTACAI